MVPKKEIVYFCRCRPGEGLPGEHAGEPLRERLRARSRRLPGLPEPESLRQRWTRGQRHPEGSARAPDAESAEALGHATAGQTLPQRR